MADDIKGIKAGEGVTKSRWMNFSVEHVIAEYRDCLDTARVYSARVREGDKDKIELLAQINLKLEDINQALFPNEGRRKIFLAWRLIHRIGEDFILLMSFDELLAHGRKILHDLRTSNLSDIVRLDWLPKVEESVKNLEKLCSEEELEDASMQIRCTSQLFHTVTNIINDYVDDRFWDIWARKYMAFIYSLILTALMVFLLLFFYYRGVYISYVTIAVIGMIGGLASGVLTSEQEYFAKGHFWVTSISYPIQRMVQGWLAALLMFAMIQGGFLVKILPPIDEQQRVPFAFASPIPFTNSTSVAQAKQATTAFPSPKRTERQPPEKSSEEAASSKAAQGAGTSTEPSQGSASFNCPNTLFNLTAPKDKQFYLCFVMLLIAGFAGDKLLKAVSDRVTSRLFAMAEKTKEAK